jgi:hypothetical protein
MIDSFCHRAPRSPLRAPFTGDDFETILDDMFAYVRDMLGVKSKNSRLSEETSGFRAIIRTGLGSVTVAFDGAREITGIHANVPVTILPADLRIFRPMASGVSSDLTAAPGVALAETLEIIAEAVRARQVEMQFVAAYFARAADGFALELVDPVAAGLDRAHRLCRAFVVG